MIEKCRCGLSAIRLLEDIHRLYRLKGILAAPPEKNETREMAEGFYTFFKMSAPRMVDETEKNCGIDLGKVREAIEKEKYLEAYHTLFEAFFTCLEE